MKKKILAALAVTALLYPLSACSSDDDGGTDSAATASAGGTAADTTTTTTDSGADTSGDTATTTGDGDGDGDGDTTTTTTTGGDGDGDGDECAGVTPPTNGAAYGAACNAFGEEAPPQVPQTPNSCTMAGGSFCFQGGDFSICMPDFGCSTDCDCSVDPETGIRGTCNTMLFMGGTGICQPTCGPNGECPTGTTCGGLGQLGLDNTCLAVFSCGDDARNYNEECDGADTESCTDLGYDAGNTSCSSECDLDQTGCTSTCGNDSVGTGEQCDGTNLDMETCTSRGYAGADVSSTADDGTLGCQSTGMDACQFDETGCNAVCGNGVAEPGEQCDGTDLGASALVGSDSNGDGMIDCRDVGYFAAGAAGAVTCDNSCQLVNTCANDCGNNFLEPGETCDGSQFDESFTCAGMLVETCSMDCQTATCEAP